MEDPVDIFTYGDEGKCLWVRGNGKDMQQKMVRPLQRTSG